MARIFTESFESVPVGSAVSTANTTFDVVTAGVTAVSSPVAVGSRAARIVLGATAAARNLQVSPSTLGTRSFLYAAEYFTLAALPGGAWYPMLVNSNGTARADVRVNSNGTVTARNGFTAVWTSTLAVPVGQLVRLEWELNATALRQTVHVYLGHSTTVLFTSGALTYNQGTFTTFSAGAPVAVANLDVTVDWVALDDSTWVGSASPNTPPTVNAGANQTNVAANAAVTLTGTASDPDGTIASTSWSQVAGSPSVILSGTGNTRTFTAPSLASPTTLTFRFSATDNAGATVTDDMTVAILASSGGGGTGAPVVNAGADLSVEPWSTVTLTGTASDPDGITSQSWSQTTGSPSVTLSGSGATRTFAAPATLAGTTLTFTYSATDASAATSSDVVTVTVYPATERAVIGGVEVPLQVTKVSTGATTEVWSGSAAWSGAATWTGSI